jgi:hypothetical protein
MLLLGFTEIIKVGKADTLGYFMAKVFTKEIKMSNIQNLLNLMGEIPKSSDYETFYKNFSTRFFALLNAFKTDLEIGLSVQKDNERLRGQIFESKNRKEILDSALNLIQDSKTQKGIRAQIDSFQAEISKAQAELEALPKPKRLIEVNQEQIESLTAFFYESYKYGDVLNENLYKIAPLYYCIMQKIVGIQGLIPLPVVANSASDSTDAFLKKKGKTSAFRDEVRNWNHGIWVNSDYATSYKKYSWKENEKGNFVLKERNININIQVLVSINYSPNSLVYSVYDRIQGALFEYVFNVDEEFNISVRTITYTEDKMKTIGGEKKKKSEWARETNTLLEEYMEGWSKFFPEGSVDSSMSHLDLIDIVDEIKHILSEVHDKHKERIELFDFLKMPKPNK